MRSSGAYWSVVWLIAIGIILFTAATLALIGGSERTAATLALATILCVLGIAFIRIRHAPTRSPVFSETKIAPGVAKPLADASGGERAPQTSVLAVVALVFALLGFGPIAIVLAFIAKGQINRTGEHGAGIAFAALVLGLLSTIVVGAIVVSLLAG
ncbi:DUF4190 domain-containing protein [Nocardia niigatensis]